MDNNGYLKILKVSDYGNKVKVTYKVLRNTGRLFYSSERNQKPQFKIMIDYFDEIGEITGGDGQFIHEDNDEMVAGQIGNLCFTKPKDAKSYRVWLSK